MYINDLYVIYIKFILLYVYLKRYQNLCDEKAKKKENALPG